MGGNLPSMLFTRRRSIAVFVGFVLLSGAVALSARFAPIAEAAGNDFNIQRGTFTMTGTTKTLTAGTDYVAPTASTSAFIRITNIGGTGAGDASASVPQAARDVTAYVQDPSDIMTSVTFARDASATGTTRISWEIVEFTGESGSDNEMIVRSQSTVTYGGSSLTATGTAATGVADDADIVVFITGEENPNAGSTQYNTGESTSAWDGGTNQPVFTRGEAGGDAAI
ncbi:MAG TPA: hypothetical protein VFS75_02395, partial [Candidatus Paceibacterota bacterium]|nr:hypothetical protein [Candidatus Paceibacterota bacterium]